MIGNKTDRYKDNPFRSDNGQHKTLALFIDIRWDYDNALYTLKDQDVKHKGKTFKSLRRLYLECGDVTEYDFANQYLEGWSHWQRVCESPTLSKYIEEWREELEVKLRSQAIKGIVAESRSDSRSAFQAQKWLADKGWDKRPAGAPSKDEKAKQLKIHDKIKDELDSDLDRMREFH